MVFLAEKTAEKSRWMKHGDLTMKHGDFSKLNLVIEKHGDLKQQI